MNAARSSALVGATLALALATLGARPLVHADTIAPDATPLPAVLVLARYEKALAALRRPTAITFDYSVEQLGLRNMEQTHHVYRSGLSERDETLVVDGYTLTRPSVRILANRTSHYDIAAVAPKPSSYKFAFAGAVPRGTAFAYVFRTAALADAPFAVTEIEIDGARFLPSVVRFKIASGDARGSGRLAYAPNGRYWLVRDAQVNAHLAGGATAHEHIAWSDYSFPSALPPSTFENTNPYASEKLERRFSPAESGP
jgi:hypothetical protein